MSTHPRVAQHNPRHTQDTHSALPSKRQDTSSPPVQSSQSRPKQTLRCISRLVFSAVAFPVPRDDVCTRMPGPLPVHSLSPSLPSPLSLARACWCCRTDIHRCLSVSGPSPFLQPDVTVSILFLYAAAATSAGRHEVRAGLDLHSPTWSDPPYTYLHTTHTSTFTHRSVCDQSGVVATL